MERVRPWLIAVMGQTASGKTDLAEQLAARLDAQLLNSDSFQVYRGLDIGTAKSPHKAAYRLIDIKDPDEPFGVGEWVQLACAELEELFSCGQSAVVVGGSGLNVRALFESYDGMASAPNPELRAQLNARFTKEGLAALVTELEGLDPEVSKSVDLNNPIRVIRALEKLVAPATKVRVQVPPFRKAKFALNVPTELISERISARTRLMIEGGWIKEVETLGQAGYGPNAPAFRAHGYRELWRVSQGELGLEEAIASINLQVKHYAKRQRTWLRTEPHLTVIESWRAHPPVGEVLDRLFALEKVD
jgi:tRNA dimethylallyltransferase